MTVRPQAIVVMTVLAAIVAFCVVQDRVTAAGARRYATLQRAALEGHGRAVTIDEIMRPAVKQSVNEGLLWGGGVLIAGLGVAGAVARGRR